MGSFKDTVIKGTLKVFGKIKTNIIEGNLVGNADSASKLKTARNIKVDGDTVGEISFDGTKDITISTKRRGCIVGHGENPTENTWYKVASTNIPLYTGGSNNSDIIFLVTNANQGYNDFGILRAKIRCNGSDATINQISLDWLLSREGTTSLSNTSNVLAYSDTNPLICELWINISIESKFKFEVLSESSGTRMENVWTLYNTTVPAAEVTSGYTQISSVKPIQRTDIYGNTGFNNRNASEAIDINGNARIRDANSLKFGGSGKTDAKFELKYNEITKSLDINSLL